MTCPPPYRIAHRNPMRRRLLAVSVASILCGGAHGAVITVNTASDVTAPGQCSLRNAVTAANLDGAVASCSPGSGADVIRFASGITDIVLTDTVVGQLVVTAPLTIDGGTTQVTVRRTSDNPLASRLIDVTQPVPLVLNRMTIRGGRTATGYGEGGGIRSVGEVTLTGSTVSGNTTTGGLSRGGGIRAARLTLLDSVVADNETTSGGSGGGGISADHVLMVRSSVTGNTTGWGAAHGGGIAATDLDMRHSTVSGNSVTGPQANGGGISAGTATITNSTVSGNSVTSGSGLGGGMSVGIAVIHNSTITRNSITFGAVVPVAGGGLHLGTAAPSTIVSSIVSGNDGPPSAVNIGAVGGGSASIAGSHNLIGPVGGNVTLPGDTLACDPALLSLTDNGGPTRTHALVAGSCAIGAGSNPEGLSTDQRGSAYVRHFGQGVDIGAFELQPDGEIIFVDGFGF
jgi:hypothetical protein